MFGKIKTFWQSFWDAIKTAYNKAFKEPVKECVQAYRDTRRVNFLAVFVSKLNNLANTESTYDVESDSAQADRLKELCKDIEDKRFDIVSEMLGTGDYWIFPAHNERGELYHRYVTQDKVRVLNMDGENITDVIGVIDEYVDDKNQVYFLNRRQVLENGSLTIETYVTNECNARVHLAEWEHLNGVVYRFDGAGHIGVGRFKSPASSRGLSTVYGVPLNFGCEEIEERIFHDLEMIESEFENAASKIFTDPRNLVKDEKTGEYRFVENIFAIQQRAGQTGANIDVYAPSIRYNEYQAKLIDDMRQYEQQVGTDRGFLTPFDSGTATTATEIRRANASTIALIDKIHTAVKHGVQMTLAADAVFLNVSGDLYSVRFDFFDAFEDTDKQYDRLASAVDRGVLEKEDELRWLYPNMTDEEIAEKLERISAQAQTNTDQALERILAGQ